MGCEALKHEHGVRDGDVLEKVGSTLEVVEEVSYDGAFTFVYAKGLSYLTPDPRACLNCHVMYSQYDGWL